MGGGCSSSIRSERWDWVSGGWVYCSGQTTWRGCREESDRSDCKLQHSRSDVVADADVVVSGSSSFVTES